MLAAAAWSLMLLVLGVAAAGFFYPNSK